MFAHFIIKFSEREKRARARVIAAASATQHKCVFNPQRDFNFFFDFLTSSNNETIHHALSRGEAKRSFENI